MEKVIVGVKDWEKSNIQVFWGEIAPCDHLVQFYENDKIFLDTLEGFAGSGFLASESVIIIAQADHINDLNTRLLKQGFDLKALALDDQYITIEASEILSQVLQKEWLDEALFETTIVTIINRARKNNRKVRTFGEMVAVLWAQGRCGVTIQMEHMWHKLREKNHFTLFCAYPKIGFTQSPKDSIESICKSHSKVIDGQARPVTEIYYKSIA